MWRFVAGLTKFKHFQGHIMKHKTYGKGTMQGDDEIIVTDHFIQCLFEAQTFTYFLSPPKPKVCRCELSAATPLDLYALGYCISSIPIGVAWEVECFYSPTEYFTKPFMKNTPSANVIKKLSFSGTFDIIELQLCDFKHLRFLHLDCDFTNTDLIHLSELILNMPSLEVLELHHQLTPQDDGFLKVLQQLSHSNVTTLSIRGIGFCSLLQSNSRHDYISALKSLIDLSSGRLQELTAGDDTGDGDDGTLASLLSPPTSLRKLHLWEPNLCFSHFEDNTCLTTLSIVDWSNLLLPAVVKIVKHNKTLLYMKLTMCYVPELDKRARDPVLGAIADALQGNTTLQEFEVACHHDPRQHKAFTLDKRLVLTGTLSYM